MRARCKGEKSKTYRTSLEHNENCAADIANKNGGLICALQGHPHEGLHAICKSVDGHDAPAAVRDADRCAQGVVNINGILSCEVSGVLPPGSYIATCRDVRLQGTTLYATCNDGKDHWLSASLRDAEKCNGDIANQNGALR